jgi:bacterioferritin (cytochrome b1)
MAMNPSNATKDAIDSLNSLLRGELSAVETYRQAIDKLDGGLGTTELSRLNAEHLEAADILRDHVLEHGGTPDDSSGAWGTFAQTVEGAAKLLGNKAAIGALKRGEEAGINSYENALTDENLPTDCKMLIRDHLLPQTRQHLPILDRLMEMQ